MSLEGKFPITTHPLDANALHWPSAKKRGIGFVRNPLALDPGAEISNLGTCPEQVDLSGARRVQRKLAIYGWG